MFEQTEEVISLVLSPRSRQDSFDINLSFVREFSKPKGTVIIPCDDSADEVSTLASSVASSNLCSQTFETPERSRRKRSYSDENIQMTFDDVYDRVDSFLDKEGLFIVSPSPIVARKNLKQCALTNLTGLCQTMEQNTQAGLNLLSGKDIQKSTLPGFLIKRVASSGQPAQSQPTIETKSSFNRSLVCNKNRTSTLASLRLSLA